MRRRWLDVLLAIVVPVGLIAILYLSPFANDPDTMPFGGDTPAYIWRLNVVHDLGIGALTKEATNAPKPLGERPGYLVVLSLLRSVTGYSSLTLMWLAPALMACGVGLAAGSLSADGALERRRRSGAVALAVGASAFVAWTAVGYATNLAFDVVAVAVAVVALRVARGRPGVLIGALLLAGGVLLHWVFAVLFVAMLGVVVVVKLVRPGPADSEIPPRLAVGRLAAMLALGLALGAAVMVLAPEHPSRVPEVRPGAAGPEAKVRNRLPAMALPVTLPLAALAVGVLALDRRRERRDAALLLGVWSSIALISVLAWFVLDRSLPPYRWAGFALAIPAAIVLGAFAGGDRLRTMGRSGLGSAAVSLGLVAAVGLAGAGASVWWTRTSTMTSAELAQLGTLASYARTLPAGTRIVILIAVNTRLSPINRARAGLPSDRVADVIMTPARIQPRAPDLGLGPDVVGDGPAVVVALDAYRGPLPDVGRDLGPGVHLLSDASGVPPAQTPVGTPPRAPSAVALGAGLAALLLVLVLVGAGWAAGLSDLPMLGVISVAPGCGLALLSMIGLVSNRLGVPLRGPGGVGILVGTALAGAALAIVRRGRPGLTAQPDPAV